MKANSIFFVHLYGLLFSLKSVEIQLGFAKMVEAHVCHCPIKPISRPSNLDNDMFTSNINFLGYLFSLILYINHWTMIESLFPKREQENVNKVNSHRILPSIFSCFHFLLCLLCCILEPSKMKMEDCTIVYTSNNDIAEKTGSWRRSHLCNMLHTDLDWFCLLQV